jgi:hypothetical protein
MLPLILLLAGCATAAGPTAADATAFAAQLRPARCAGQKPIVISDQSKLVAKDWDQLLAYNCWGVAQCGWKPPKDPTICAARK